VVGAPLASIVDTRRMLARRGKFSISVLEPVAPLDAQAAEEEGAIREQAAAVRGAMQAELDRLAGLAAPAPPSEN